MVKAFSFRAFSPTFIFPRHDESAVAETGGCRRPWLLVYKRSESQGEFWRGPECTAEAALNVGVGKVKDFLSRWIMEH